MVANDPITPLNQGKKLPQYIAALSVCLGSVAAGTVLSWTANIDLKKNPLNDISVDTDELGWIGSFTPLGAVIMCFPIGSICDLIGRKTTMLSMIVLFTLGWLLIIFSNGLPMIYAGRFITGMAGGSFCIAAPMYTSEIAEKEIRGALGSYFQLLLTVGILIGDVLGAYLDIKIFTIICALFPLLFGAVFFFQPETPIYSMKKGQEDAARKALRRLRGDAYDVEAELKIIKQQLDFEAQNKIAFSESFKKIQTKKALVICFGLMVLQQFSGINAVIFFTGEIFKQAGSELGAIPTIIVGVMQVIATFVSSLIVDKFGRKILLMGSDFFMAVSGFLLGVFFTLKDRHVLDEDTISKIAFLPILSLCIFIVVFSLGFGPIPWMISSELFPPEIKSVASSAAGTLNWIIAFLVTKYFLTLSDAVGGDTTFYIFTGFSLLGTVFIYFVCPETKGKTLDEIQRELGGETKLSETNGIENEAFQKTEL